MTEHSEYGHKFCILYSVVWVRMLQVGHAHEALSLPSVIFLRFMDNQFLIQAMHVAVNEALPCISVSYICS